VSAARIDLAFDQPDDSWDVDRYELFDGSAPIASIPAVSWSGIPTVTLPLRGLSPQSSHTYSVRAIRQTSGASPSSGPLTLTTLPRTDLEAPSAPTAFTARTARYACFTVTLTWTPSSDDTDPRSAIDYEILVNDAHDHWARGLGTTTIGMIPVGDNTITIRAVDSSGNASAPATTTFVRDPSCTDDA
jgi:hypothetical protein